jgi:hypothetical protein
MEKIYFEPNNPNKLSETNEIHNSPWDGSNISDPPPRIWKMLGSLHVKYNLKYLCIGNRLLGVVVGKIS